MDYRFFLDLALILFSTKLFGIILRKFGLPQVLGALLAGVLLGITKLIKVSDELTVFGTIGVNLLMFTAGMEINIKEIKKNGVASVVITTLGVVVPLLVGFGVAFMIPNISMKERMFFGVITTATSVGITVAVLKELGALHGKVGVSIVTAAILDDIIGVVILAFFTAHTSPTTLGARFLTAIGKDYTVHTTAAIFINVILFFIVGISFGILMHLTFKKLSQKFPATRRLAIFGIMFCFIYAWGAEELFGLAAITGSFLAGMMISNMPQTSYVERKIDIAAYMIFTPVFFAGIGIALPYDKLASGFTWLIFGFSIVYILTSFLSKLVGCGLGAAMCKYTKAESLKVGTGMIVRGEVSLIIAEAGRAVGLIDEVYYPAIIGLVIISSLVPPIMLKMLYKKYPHQELATQHVGNLTSVEAVQSIIESTSELIITTQENIDAMKESQNESNISHIVDNYEVIFDGESNDNTGNNNAPNNDNN